MPSLAAIPHHPSREEGKKSAWDAWNAYQEVTEAFLSALDGKFTAIDANSAAFSVIERFIVVLYDKHSSASKVNATPRELFTKKC